MKSIVIPALLSLLFFLPAQVVRAQEAPYFVTYDHHLEEPRNLEIGTSATVGTPGAGQSAFFAPYMELEYGVKAWWTSELYLEGQSTVGDSGVFTGWRLENRFRVLSREHRINPVLYLEYENINEASHIFKEIVGNTGDADEPVAELSKTRAHELETKLILSSDIHSWNFAENFIVEKNLSENEGFEFGYAVGFYRPLATMASAKQCRLCRENFAAGLEMYGGLGSTLGFGLHNTTHYLAPVIAWQLSDNASLHFAPAVRLTDVGSPVLFRIGYSYEVRGFGRKVARLFGGKG
ncbi:MAG TPA: hypothetical protein VMT53_02330 [Terriglobales bacterium]|nr:hypothetical protein [Terriglobales bacterium]